MSSKQTSFFSNKKNCRTVKFLYPGKFCSAFNGLPMTAVFDGSQHPRAVCVIPDRMNLQIINDVLAGDFNLAAIPSQNGLVRSLSESRVPLHMLSYHPSRDGTCYIKLNGPDRGVIRGSVPPFLINVAKDIRSKMFPSPEK